MSDLLLPGSHRAEGVFDDASVVSALLHVEETWSQVLVVAGIAPRSAGLDPGLLGHLLDLDDGRAVAEGAEGAGNPVVGLVAVARRALAGAGRGDAATWLHRGLTSQDVLDTALVLCLRDATARVEAELRLQTGILAALAERHRDTVQAGRTLTQHAVPTTFGLVAAGWVHSILDAHARLHASVDLPVQLGGAAGTLSGVVELAAGQGEGGQAPASSRATACAADLAERLGLSLADPWHVRRSPLTALADGLTTCTDAWAAIASSVLVLTRPEVAEVREGRGGGSSTMPHKSNPVLSALLRRAGLLAPHYSGALHLAASLAEDQRSSGPWHAEWPLLRDLARTTVVAASQATDLVGALAVDVERMRETALAAQDDLLAERGVLRELTGAGLRVDDGVEEYLGAAGRLVDAAVGRAHAQLAALDARARR